MLIILREILILSIVKACSSREGVRYEMRDTSFEYMIPWQFPCQVYIRCIDSGNREATEFNAKITFKDHVAAGSGVDFFKAANLYFSMYSTSTHFLYGVPGGQSSQSYEILAVERNRSNFGSSSWTSNEDCQRRGMKACSDINNFLLIL